MGVAASREGTAPDGDALLFDRSKACWHALGSFGIFTSRRNCGTTRELSGGKHCGYHIRFLRRRPQSVVQKLQSRTSFISDTALSEEAAFTLASRSLLTEDPPPSVLLRVASGALIGPSHRVFCGATQLMAARRRGTVRVVEARSYAVLP